jgi:hypothetical protein
MHIWGLGAQLALQLSPKIPLAEAEAISTLLHSRPGLAAAASGWDVHPLEAHEFEERERRIARREQAAKTRADNVQGLAP